MYFTTLADDIDFTSFVESYATPFETTGDESNILCVSPNQTVPSVSPDGSPSPYSSDNPDFYYLNEDLFGSLNDVCPLPVPPVPIEAYPLIKSETFLPAEPPKTKPTAPKTSTTNTTVLGKRRTRKDPSPPSKSTPLDFQSLDSKSLEQRLESGRTLTIDEEKHLKRQRRLLKNRESAQLSRQRKKQYIADLEKNVREMTSETEHLRQQVHQLNSRNADLENQVAQLKSMINSQISMKHPKAAIGLCMIVFLLSLGLFFPQNTPGSHPEYSTHPRSVYTGRILQELPQSAGDLGPIDSELSLLEKRQKEYVPEERPGKRARLEALDDGVGELSSSSSSPKRDDAYGLMVVDPRSRNIDSLEQSEEEEIKTSSDTSYIYCSEAHPLSVTSNPPSSSAAPPVVTVLLPASALNGTIPHMDSFLDEPDNTLLEVSCQILNITVYPFYPGVDGRLAFPPMIES